MNEVKKAVILARGLGNRMRTSDEKTVLSAKQSEIARRGIKTLIPIVGNKTLLDFIFENLSKAGFSEFCLVIGNEHQEIENYCARLNYDISFAMQEKPLGTANAVLSVEKFVDGEKFLTVNSDNLYPVSSLADLRNIDTAGLIAFDKQSLIAKSNIDEVKINKFAILDIDQDQYLSKIVEKPETTSQNALISMNAWLFSSKIFDACRNIKLSPRGEFEIADAVNYAIEKLDEKFFTIFSNEGVLDLSSQTDIEKVREKLS